MKQSMSINKNITMSNKVENKQGYKLVLEEDISIKECFFLCMLPSWDVILDSKPDGKQTPRQIAEAKLELLDKRKIHTFPSKWEIANPYYYIRSPDNVKVLILGMDPYGTPGYAMGLAFSMRKGIKISKSLENIFNVLNRFSGYEFPKNNNNGSLIKWSLQGVMLINVALTIGEGGKSGEHLTMWSAYTELFIKALTLYKKGIIIVLWGKDAQEYKNSIKQPQEHHILMGAHPAARGNEFIDQFEENPPEKEKLKKQSHFETINEILTKRGDSPIDWSNY